MGICISKKKPYDGPADALFKLCDLEWEGIGGGKEMGRKKIDATALELINGAKGTEGINLRFQVRE